MKMQKTVRLEPGTLGWAWNLEPVCLEPVLNPESMGAGLKLVSPGTICVAFSSELKCSLQIETIAPERVCVCVLGSLW